MGDRFITVKGARQHNLKNITVKIPKNKLVVFTGVSGSGKSSLAIDTIYAEGQRRYVESLSSYARQFLGIMDKPDVDLIEGLSPSIAINQKGVSRNPRSTVGTITEIYDYLRLLFARGGHPHCPACGKEIAHLSIDQIVAEVLKDSPAGGGKGLRLAVLAPIVRDKRGEFGKLFENLKKQGFAKVRIDGKIHSLDEDFRLIKTNRHNIDIVVDRLVVEATFGRGSAPSRLTAAVELALKLADGNVIVSEIKDKTFQLPDKPKELRDRLFSERFACPRCRVYLPEIEPRTFSFNSPHGACSGCDGIGLKLKIDPALVINPRLSLDEGGILPWSRLLTRDTWFSRLVAAVAERHKFSLSVPLGELPDAALKILLHGGGSRLYKVAGTTRHGRERTFSSYFEGVVPNLERRHRETKSAYIRGEIEKYMVKEPCSLCRGARLKREALGITVAGKNIAQVASFSVKDFNVWLKTLSRKGVLSAREKTIARPILLEIQKRVKFLLDVGLGYLTLDRKAATLAGGEAQRIRLASQIGSGLSGVLYVLDEPSVGLHFRDQKRLINTLKKLRDLGNTVIVVEHDRQTILAADYIFDFGPGAGDHGGSLVAQGTPAQLAANKKSLTGEYLSGKRRVNLGERSPEGDNPPVGNFLTIFGCSQYNLKNIDVSFPLGKLICVTGVSGSGKSTLVNETLYRVLRQRLGYREKEKAGSYRELAGLEAVRRVASIDQSPVGRTPRSNPATYTKAFDGIRQLFSKTREAKIKGYRPGRFSFNVKGGRCEACQGEGQVKIEMQFMPDIYVNCEVCRGKRFNGETLEVEYKGKNIAEVLEMTVEEAVSFFSFLPYVRNKLQTLFEVGLGYLRLGQPAPTLSGGEAQRVKLAAELSKKSAGGTVYFLDEPTTGLHFADLERLLQVLRRLVKKGNTVIVIEHNLEVVKAADWIIDLGPEGGRGGGRVIFAGPPAEITKEKKSHTGQALKQAAAFAPLAPKKTV